MTQIQIPVHPVDNMDQDLKRVYAQQQKDNGEPEYTDDTDPELTEEDLEENDLKDEDAEEDVEWDPASREEQDADEDTGLD